MLDWYFVQATPSSGCLSNVCTQVTWLSQYCVIIGSSSTKISILLFYRRLAANSYTKSFLWAVRLGILYNALYCFGFMLYIVVECRPLVAYWQKFSTQWNEKFTCGNVCSQVRLVL